MCNQLFELRRMEGDSLDDFLIRFKLILMQFQSKDLPPQFQLMGWFKHLIYLPCIPYQESENSFTFIEESTPQTINNDPLLETGIANERF